jgi:uncharacterized BrkB/YihY/UPF0761 family membrane protein
MLTIFVLLEFAGFMAAMSVVAWLRYPSKAPDNWRLGCLRYLAPPAAILVFVGAVVAMYRWLTGQRLEMETPSAGLLIAMTFMLILSIAYAIFAVREHHTTGHPRQRSPNRRLDRRMRC